MNDTNKVEWDRVPIVIRFVEAVKFAETYGFSGSQGMVALEGQQLKPPTPSDTVYIFMHPSATLQLLPMPQALAEEASEANRDISVFLAHGEHDPMIALTRAQASRTHLEALNYSVQWHTYPMEHAVSPQEIMDIDAWLESMIPASA